MLPTLVTKLLACVMCDGLCVACVWPGYLCASKLLERLAAGLI